MKKLLLPIITFFLSISLEGQVGFIDKSKELLNNDKIYTTLSISIADLNGDYYDDITVLDKGIYLKTYMNVGDISAFSFDSIAKTFEKAAWTINTGDFNNDGKSEIYTCGAQTFGNLYTFKDSTYVLTDELKNVSYAQNSNIVDINNDGYLDLFVCNENNYNAIYINDGIGKLKWNDFINFKVDSNYNNYGDYGSDFIDFDDDGDLDLFITKCWPGAERPNDPRRVNTLFVNDGNNNYTDKAKYFGLNSGAQSWTGMFGDMDNDGDLDCFVTNHDTMHYYYENIENDTFIMKTGIDFPVLNCSSIQASLRDFDNNGFLDILISGDKSFLVWNYGNNNYSVEEKPFGRGQIHSFGIGDLNNDGFLDIYTSYGKGLNEYGNYKDLIWMNKGNTNHYVKFSFLGTESNRQGIGAKVKIFGSWGLQTRDVRIGESYGITNSVNVNFGLGDAENIDSVFVKWPSGISDKYYDISPDNHYLLHEGMGMNEFFEIYTIGDLKFCTGDSVILQAPAGSDYHYKWSTGAKTKAITVKKSGSYNATITNSYGVVQVSKLVKTELNPYEKPEIDITKGYIANCINEKVELSCTEKYKEYQWSKNEESLPSSNTANLFVSDPGDYSVKAQGTCDVIYSDTVFIDFLKVENPTVTYNDTIYIKRPDTLYAEGDIVLWYDSQTASNPLDTGGVFITDTIDSYTVYWAENLKKYIFETKNIGIKDNQSSQTGSESINGGLVFDCHKDVILKSVKVYSSKEGVRRFQIKNKDGIIVQYKDVNIQTGQHRVGLNFELKAGTDYRIETDIDVNIANLQAKAPYFFRDNDAFVNYPYENKIISINESYFGKNYYYYFYDWEIAETGLECSSERIAIPIVFDPRDRVENTIINGVKILPNPAKGIFRLNSTKPIFKIEIYDNMGQTILKENLNGDFNFKRNISDYEQGIYFIKVTHANSQSVLKLVKN